MDSKQFLVRKAAVGAMVPVVTMMLGQSAAMATSVDSLTQNKVLSGHIPQYVQKMNDVGALSEDKNLSVTVALNLNHEDELDQRIAEMYQEGSPNFHHFLSTAEFKDRYSPTQEQVAAEKAFLEANGLTVQSINENRMLMHVKGSVADLNATFHTELHQYRNIKGETYFAPIYEPLAPTESRIGAVIGLSNTAHAHTHLKFLASPKDDGSTPSGLNPSNIITAYSVPGNLTGKGQTLALFELDGYTPSDVTTYEDQYKLPHVPMKNVLIDGFDGSAGDGAIEVTLDIEMMAAIAPGVKQIIVYEGPNSSQGLVDVYAKIANDNLAMQISSSWGMPEDKAASADMQAESKIFKQMVAQGQSLFSAAGDNGADDDGSALSVDDPSGQPFVVGVGGTMLTTNANGSYKSETTWNELTNQEGAGGGGVSIVWPIPSWQKNVNVADTQVSTKMRNVPDVCLNADPVSGYAVYSQASWQPVGGTSAAAPLWAAFMALVNEERANKGLKGAGFVNPALYAIGKSSSYSSAFHDIIDGSNNGNYKALKGYDNATGWGSFIGTELLALLSAK